MRFILKTIQGQRLQEIADYLNDPTTNLQGNIVTVEKVHNAFGGFYEVLIDTEASTRREKAAVELRGELHDIHQQAAVERERRELVDQEQAHDNFLLGAAGKSREEITVAAHEAAGRWDKPLTKAESEKLSSAAERVASGGL